MTRTLWLVRHGPTHAKTAIGWTDLAADLSDTKKIARLDAFLPRPARLVSSDLLRATATADRLGEGRSRLGHMADLREMHFGRWEDLAFDALPEEDRAHARSFWEEPGDIAAPGGESMNALSTRVVRSLDALTGAEDPHTIVVAHMGVIMAALAHATGMEQKASFGFRIDPLSVTRLDYLPDAKAWRVGMVNHQP